MSGLFAATKSRFLYDFMRKRVLFALFFNCKSHRRNVFQLYYLFLMYPNWGNRASSQLWCLWSESCCWSLSPHGQTSHLEDVAPQEAMLHTSASRLKRAVTTNRSLVCIQTNKENSSTPGAFIVKCFFLFLYKKGRLLATGRQSE